MEIKKDLIKLNQQIHPGEDLVEEKNTTKISDLGSLHSYAIFKVNKEECSFLPFPIHYLIKKGKKKLVSSDREKQRL